SLFRCCRPSPAVSVMSWSDPPFALLLPSRICLIRLRPEQLYLSWPWFPSQLLRLLTPPLSVAAGAVGKGVSAKGDGGNPALGGGAGTTETEALQGHRALDQGRDPGVKSHRRRSAIVSWCPLVQCQLMPAASCARH